MGNFESCADVFNSCVDFGFGRTSDNGIISIDDDLGGFSPKYTGVILGLGKTNPFEAVAQVDIPNATGLFLTIKVVDKFENLVVTIGNRKPMSVSTGAWGKARTKSNCLVHQPLRPAIVRIKRMVDHEATGAYVCQ